MQNFKLFNASQTIATTGRNPLSAYAASTFVFSLGASHRENVLGRIFIAVMLIVALWALPLTNAEGHFRHAVSATGASLAGGLELIDLDQRSSVPVSLIFQLPQIGGAEHGCRRTERTRTSAKEFASVRPLGKTGICNF